MMSNFCLVISSVTTVSSALADWIERPDIHIWFNCFGGIHKPELRSSEMPWSTRNLSYRIWGERRLEQISLVISWSVMLQDYLQGGGPAGIVASLCCQAQNPGIEISLIASAACIYEWFYPLDGQSALELDRNSRSQFHSFFRRDAQRYRKRLVWIILLIMPVLIMVAWTDNHWTAGSWFVSRIWACAWQTYWQVNASIQLEPPTIVKGSIEVCCPRCSHLTAFVWLDGWW